MKQIKVLTLMAWVKTKIHHFGVEDWSVGNREAENRDLYGEQAGTVTKTMPYPLEKWRLNILAAFVV